MGAVRCEYREIIALDPFYPAGYSGRLPISLSTIRVFVNRQPHLSLRKVRRRPKREPDGRSIFDQAGENVANDRYPNHKPCNRVNDDTDLEQEVAPGGITLRLGTRWRMTFGFVWCHYWFEVEGCVPVVASAVFVACPG